MDASFQHLAPVRYRLRPDLEISRCLGGDFSGQMTVSDPLNGRSYRFGSREYYFAGLLDGKRPFGEVLDEMRQTMPQAIPNDEDVFRLLVWMEERHLLQMCGSAPSEVVTGVPASPDRGQRGKGILKLAAAVLILAGCGVAFQFSGVSLTEVKGLLSFKDRSQSELATVAEVEEAEVRYESPAAEVKQEEPPEPTRKVPSFQISQVLAGHSGLLSQVYVKDGQIVQKGDLIALMENPEARNQLKRLKAEINACRARRDRHYETNHMAAYQEEIKHLARLTRQIGEQEAALVSLEVRAPAAGKVQDPEVTRKVGAWLDTGDVVLSLQVDPSELDEGMLAGVEAGE